MTISKCIEFLEIYLDQYEVYPIDQDASLREYYRIYDTKLDKKYVLMHCPVDYDSILPFINVNKYLEFIKVKVPEIFYYSVENGMILMEDLGSSSARYVLNCIEDTKDEFVSHFNIKTKKDLYKCLIDALCNIQKNSVLYSDKVVFISNYTDNNRLKELDIFFNWYFKYQNIDKLSDETVDYVKSVFKDLLYSIRNVGFQTLVHRDYHIDNLMMCKNSSQTVGVLDFQDAKYGSSIHDIAMLLDDARYYVDPNFKVEMQEYYLSLNNTVRTDFFDAYDIISTMTNLRIIGVFSRKVFLEKNTKYKKFMDNTKKYIIDTLSKNKMMSPISRIILSHMSM